MAVRVGASSSRLSTIEVTGAGSIATAVRRANAASRSACASSRVARAAAASLSAWMPRSMGSRPSSTSTRAARASAMVRLSASSARAKRRSAASASA